MSPEILFIIALSALIANGVLLLYLMALKLLFIYTRPGQTRQVWIKIFRNIYFVMAFTRLADNPKRGETRIGFAKIEH